MTLEIGTPTTEIVPFNLDEWEPEKVWIAGIRGVEIVAEGAQGPPDRWRGAVFTDEDTARGIRRLAIEKGIGIPVTDDVYEDALIWAMDTARSVGCETLGIFDEKLNLVTEILL